MQRFLFLISLTLFGCSSFGQTLRPDFEEHFKKFDVEGDFVGYHIKQNKYVLYNPETFDTPASPASTFKILNSLIALEIHAVKDANEVLRWDGIRRDVKEWNADTDMKNAFKNSTVWFYQELSRKIGVKNYERYLKSAQYGNQDISGGMGQFWLGSSLRITPRQQMLFLQKLYNNKLPFAVAVQETVKNIMISEETPTYKIRAKTGWQGYRGFGSDNRDVGWWIGYVEKGDDVFFFVTRIFKKNSFKDPNFGSARKDITKLILQDLGIIEH